MPLKLLKLNRPVATRQAVWINPEDVTHVQESTNDEDCAEVHLRNGAIIQAVESAASIAEALRIGAAEIDDDDDDKPWPEEPLPIA